MDDEPTVPTGDGTDGEATAMSAAADGPEPDAAEADAAGPDAEAEAADPEGSGADGRRRALTGGGIAAVVILVVLAAILWPRGSSDSADDSAATGKDATSTSTTTAVAGPIVTEPVSPDFRNGEGGRAPTTPPPSSTTPPGEGTAAPAPSSTSAPANGGIPTIPGLTVTLVSGPSTVFRAGPNELSCSANDTPFVVDAPGAESVILRWTTGPASGETAMERDGERWSAILLGPMSPTPTIEVRIIGGTSAGSMSAAAPATVDLANCPN